jgi:membrane-associated protease RseP (regulator of RpoE activity)
LVQPYSDARFPLIRFLSPKGKPLYERGLLLRDGRHVLAGTAWIDSASGIEVLRVGQTPVATRVIAQDRGSYLMVLETAESLGVPFSAGASTARPGDSLQVLTTRSTEQLLTLEAKAGERLAKSPLLLEVSFESRCGATSAPVLAADGSLAGWLDLLMLDKQYKKFVLDGPVVLHRADELMDFGWVRRTWMGVIGQNLTPQLAAAFSVPPGIGVIVDKFEQGSVAASAGLRAGDVITAVDGYEIHDMHDMQAASALKRPGDHVVLHFLHFDGSSGKSEPQQLEFNMPAASTPAAPEAPPGHG